MGSGLALAFAQEGAESRGGGPEIPWAPRDGLLICRLKRVDKFPLLWWVMWVFGPR